MLLSYWGKYTHAFGSAFGRKELFEEKKYQSVSSGLEEQFIISMHRIKWGMLQKGYMLSSGHTT